MLEFNLNKKAKFNPFGIFMANKSKILQLIQLSCQESEITTVITTFLHTSPGTNFQDRKKTQPIYGSLLTMGRFISLIFLLKILMVREVSNMLF